MSNAWSRYIYCYRLRATGQPVYVGSAWDVPARDRGHIRNGGKKIGLSFDKFMCRTGREQFSLEILEMVTGLTYIEAMQATNPRENYWMDKLGTWHEQGGMNYARAGVRFGTEEHYLACCAAKRAVWDRPGFRTKMRVTQSEATSAVWKRPAHREKVIPKLRDAALALWKDPEFRARITAAQSAARRRPEVRKKLQLIGVEAGKRGWETRRKRAGRP